MRACDKTKRILVDGTSLALEMKGVGRYTANVLRELSTFSLGHEYKILVEKHKPLPQLPQESCFEYIPIHLSDHLRHGWLTLPHYARALNVNTVWIPYETTLGRFPCPYSVVCHDVPHLVSSSQRVGGDRGSLKRTLVSQIDHFMIGQGLERASTVFANSHYVGNWLQRTLKIPREKIAYAPCAPGADFASLSANVNRQAVLAELDCPNGYVLVFATGDRRENFEMVLRVFDAIARDSNLSLVIAGTRGDEAHQIRAQLEKFEWHERTRVLPFFGENETQQLANVYAGASVYLDLSLHEGFGMQVIEAMACGTPVVCSNRGALPEVAGDAASLVDPESAGEIGSALKKMLAVGAERTMWIEAGRARSALYSWARTAQTILSRLQTL